MEQQLRALGAPPEKVHYNCYGVEVFPYSDDHVPVAQRPPGFMGIGRFVDKKMPVLTILAFMEALKTCPDMKLTLVGEGLLLGACKSLVKAYGLEDNVFLPGKMPHTEVLQLLHSCRGFVQHSIISMNNDHEGTPLAVLEGMAAGLPIIATAHAGIQDQVAHEVSGLLSDEHDIDAMAANLVRIAQDADLAQRMGDAGRAHIVSNLRMDQSIDRLNQIILRCASRS
jgi:glycosyltransferase involved in cell wall biosynthesis